MIQVLEQHLASHADYAHIGQEAKLSQLFFHGPPLVDVDIDFQLALKLRQRFADT
jgi:hypothetical protein